MTAALFGVFGLIVGSFLNVLILREAREESIGGRSYCPHCKKTLSPLDLVPLVSWIFLRGKCRYCKSGISLQYPLVEALTALLFFFVGSAPLSIALQVLACVIVALCIAITVYDIQYMLIPDAWSYAFSLVSVIFSISTVSDLQTIPVLLMAGPGVAFPLFMLWYVSGGRWMGFGDVKFAVGIGWLLGFYYGYVALLGAFILGALVSVCILLPLPHIISYAQRRGILQLRGYGTRFTMTSEVPFGPFLVASCLIVWFLTLHGADIYLPW
jgi:leader peptidase (prepilin peptidase) / N-methyltransferase